MITLEVWSSYSLVAIPKGQVAELLVQLCDFSGG